MYLHICLFIYFHPHPPALWTVCHPGLAGGTDHVPIVALEDRRPSEGDQTIEIQAY